jgi:hypothetical protein
VIGTGWRVGLWPSEATLSCLPAAAHWLADRGRVKLLRCA